jgi:peptidoglycan pentaglycine glycine transferase (the first glycine)
MNKLRRCTEDQEWDEYILDNRGHPLQLWGWGEVKKSIGWKVDRQFLLDDDLKIIGAAQILIKKLPWPFRSLAYIPRGPIAKSESIESFLDLLSEYVKKSYKSVALKIEPDTSEFNIPNGWVKTDNFILSSWTIRLDLNRPEADLLADIENQTRRYILKSDIETIKKVNSKAELKKCLDIYHETSKRAKFALYKDDYYYDIFDKLGDNSLVFVAYFGGSPIAFSWLVITKEVVYELYAGMNDMGRKLNANYALKWYAIRKCKEWGIDHYDFGVTIVGGAKSFKNSWAREDIKLAGTFDKPLSSFYMAWDKFLPAGKKIVYKIRSIIRI